MSNGAKLRPILFVVVKLNKSVNAKRVGAPVSRPVFSVQSTAPPYYLQTFLAVYLCTCTEETICVFVQKYFVYSIISEFTYLQSMDFQREPQSKHHLYCEQEKPAHCHGSLLIRLGTHQIQNRTRDAHKISPHGTVTKRTPAMNWDHAVSWGGGLG